MKSYLEAVILDNFRNIKFAMLTFDRGLSIIYGNNAQGKTNVIEGIYLFAVGKSFRGAKDKDLIRFGSDRAQANIVFHDSTRMNEMCYRVFAEETRRKKELFLNRVKKKSMNEMLGNFHAALFCPEHLSIVKDEPALRRNFLDNAICQLKPTYVRALSEYAKVLEQRNSLLKNHEEYSPEQFESMMEILDEKFVDSGSFITVTRAKYLRRLFEYANKYMQDMTMGAESLSFEYLCSITDYGENNYEDFSYVKNTYFIRLADKKERERFAGLSLSGAHRDDFVIYLNGKNARLYCSQGQQRSIALALKLAEGELSRECTGEYPGFLLADVFSELDKRRKEYIMSGFGDRQIILTTCEKNDFADVHDALKIETEDGKFRFTEGLERQFEYDLTEEEKEFRKSYVYSCRKE